MWGFERPHKKAYSLRFVNSNLHAIALIVAWGKALFTGSESAEIDAEISKLASLMEAPRQRERELEGVIAELDRELEEIESRSSRLEDRKAFMREVQTALYVCLMCCCEITKKANESRFILTYASLWYRYCRIGGLAYIYGCIHVVIECSCRFIK